MNYNLIPPTVPEVPKLFSRIHVDTKVMVPSGGYRYLIQARCALSGYPEFRMLRTETGKTIGQFLYQEIICRYGTCVEIISDNGTPYVAALEYLSSRYGIRHIRISAYNSRANGIVERRHLDVQESLMKTCNGNEKKWSDHIHSVFWAERITVSKATGYSPYYLVHGIEPALPFDLEEATYLNPIIDSVMTSSELLAIRARHLEKRPEEIDRIRKIVADARHKYAARFAEVNKNKIRDYNFAPGRLVLLRNSRIEKDLGHKFKPRYLGPYAVIRRTDGGAYEIAELDGAIAKRKVAAYRLIPYFSRSDTVVPVDELIAAGNSADETDDEEPDPEDAPIAYRTRNRRPANNRREDSHPTPSDKQKQVPTSSISLPEFKPSSTDRQGATSPSRGRSS